MSDAWDFYLCRMEGMPASIMVDLGIAERAPLADKPTLLCVRVPLREPRDDGLIHSEESEQLRAIEETLRVALDDADMVGRLTWNGIREFFFYAPDESSLEAAARRLARDHEGYRVLVRHEPDPDWSTYQRFLYPDAAEWRWIKNRHVVEQLAQHGDDNDTPRPIDHHVAFPDADARRAFADAAEQLGFSVDGIDEAASDGSFRLHLVREDPATMQHIHGITLELSDLAERHGGDYDGWGCPVMKATVH